MKLFPRCSLALCAMLLSAASLQAAKSPNPMDQITWIEGPSQAYMKDLAQIDVPAGYMFTDGKGARTLMQAMGNMSDNQEVGFISPTSMVWFVVFEFDPSGYVKDDDKDKLVTQADSFLESIRKGTEAANEARAKMGMPPIHVVGWEEPPHYNAETHNLEWSIRGESEGEPILNHNTRILGRKGVMHVTLVAEPKSMAAAMPRFKSLLAGYTFQTGQNYAEYKKGDKIAKYGLAGLITVGAGVAAAKLGLFAWIAVMFKKFFKLIIVAIVAVLASMKKILGRLFGSRDSTTS